MTSSNAGVSSDSGQGLLVALRTDSEQMEAAVQLVLRCAEVHPVRCDAALSSPSTSDLVSRVIDHGARAHGFTAVWYTQSRIARSEGRERRLSGSGARAECLPRALL